MRQNLRLAPNTVEAYARSLKDLLRFCARKGIEPECVGSEQIGLYVSDLASRSNLRSAKVLHIGPVRGSPTPSYSSGSRRLRQSAHSQRLFWRYPCGHFIAPDRQSR